MTEVVVGQLPFFLIEENLLCQHNRFYGKDDVMANILAVDDETAILQIIKKGLEREGHVVAICDDVGKINEDHLKHYDLMLLDVMMPGMNGYDFCKRIRNMVDFPIIFLTAKLGEGDITYGLDIGADDYITKPFRMAELRSRVNAHLRREHRSKSHRMVMDDCVFDLDGKCISINNHKMNFTKSEYLICEFLARHRSQVFSREQIYEAVFGLDGESDNGTISTHIKNIRNKFLAYDYKPISTVWGIGYKWE